MPELDAPMAGDGALNCEAFSGNERAYDSTGEWDMLLCVAGENPNDDTVNDAVHLYDLEANDWIRLPSTPSKGVYGAAVTGSLALIGASDRLYETSNSSGTYITDIADSSTGWTETFSGEGDWMGFMAEGINGLFYCGFSYDSSQDQFYEYDPDADSWTALATPPLAAQFSDKPLGSTVMGGEIYYGHCGSSPGTEFYKYDPGSDSWTDLGAMPYQAFYSLVVNDGTYVYAMGGDKGSTTGDEVDHVYQYDPGADSWTQLDPLEYVYQGAGGAVLSDGKLRTVGRYDEDVYGSTAEHLIRDPGGTSNDWQNKPDYPPGKCVLIGTDRVKSDNL